MDFVFFDQVARRPYLIPALIAASAAAALVINAWGTVQGITIVLPHLIYIPIILASYYYPRRGLAVTAAISLIYLGIILALDPGNSGTLIAALARVVVYLLIAAIISYLSGRMHADAGMCRRMASMVSSSGDAIIGMNLDGVITDWNSGAESLYGYSRAEALGKPVSFIVPPEKQDEAAGILARVRNGEVVDRLETVRVAKDNRAIHVSLAVSPILDHDGSVIGLSKTAHDITREIRMREETERAKNDWERTFDSVPDLIAIIDRNHRIVRINKAMADRLGMPAADAAGRHCYDLVHHTELPPGICPHSALLRDGEEHSLDIAEKNLAGDFTLTVAPIRGPDGTVTGSVHVLHDITERKRAEEALLEREQFLEKLIGTISSPIFFKNTSGVYLGCNSAFERFIGRSREEIVGRTVYDIAPPDLAAVYAAKDEELFVMPGSQQYESQVEFADGSQHTVIFSKSTFTDAKGKVQGLVGVILDITERTKAEEARRKMAEEINRFFAVSLDLLCIATIDGRFERLNPEWEKTLGYPLPELLGRRFLDLVHPDDREATISAMAVLAEDEPVLNFTNRYRHRDGTYRWIEWRSYPFEGKLVYASARDITDRKLEQDALALANKKINMLSSITRHDILNQIMGLRTYLELSKIAEHPSEIREYISKEDRVAEAIGRQIEFTKYYQDIGVRAAAWFDIAQVIRSASAALNLEGIELNMDLPPAGIYADPLIEKVFYNLIENSLRHGEHVTRISVSAQETGEGLVILYEDNGAGIAKDDKHRLFQKGFGKHTGLGLFLSREILAITGIAITESGEPGRGVRFEITVPRDRYQLHGNPREQDGS